MRKSNRTIKDALDNMHIACVEAVGVATKTEFLTETEAEHCFEQMNAIGTQLADLRVFIRNRTVGGL